MEEVKNVVANENFDWNAFENDLGVYDQPRSRSPRLMTRRFRTSLSAKWSRVP